MLTDTIRFATMDATLQRKIENDLSLIKSFGKYNELVERASSPYADYLSYKGGKRNEGEFTRLKLVTEKYHEKGIDIRFYAAGNNEKIWRYLLDAGVGWINVDKLKNFAKFYKEYSKEKTN